MVFYRHVREQGGIILPHGLFVGFMELMEEDKINKVFEKEGGYDVIVSILAQNGIPITIDNLIKYVFEGISFWAGAYDKFRYQKNKLNKIELVFEHTFGLKWSKVFGSQTAKFITDNTGCNVSYTTTARLVVMKVDCK